MTDGDEQRAAALPRFRACWVPNRSAGRERAYGAAQLALFDEAALEAARREIVSWPGYRPTPLIALEGLAAAAGFSRLWYKDEGQRFGLKSFKALGGAYAVLRHLQRNLAARTGREPSSAELLAGGFRALTQGLTVCSATDGNHGRSVAWGARIFGCACVIFIGRAVSEGRKRAIESYGARVVRIDGNYDDSVRHCAAEAERNGWQVISDTSWPGYSAVPREVMQGYAVMAEEIMDQLPAEDDGPSHVFVQGGVGGVAAAVCATFWRRWGAARPRFVVAEPEAADCIFKSIEVGAPKTVSGSLETFMAGLSAGEVSPLAWEVLKEGVDDVMTVEDDAARHWVKALAAPCGGDRPIAAGESAVAGLACALAAAADAALAPALGLGPKTRLLVIGTEGATDPELYRALVGRHPDEVAG